MAHQPYIERFSAGYDIAGMTVTPADAELPRIQSELYRDLQRRGELKRDSGAPVLFHPFGHEYHFEVVPDDSVPTGSLELPFDMVESLNVEPIPSTEEFLVARPRHAVRLHRLSKLGEETIE